MSCRDIEEKALEAWATRDLRSQKNRWNASKQKSPPRLPEQQLKGMFPSLTSAIIRRVLKDPNFCDLGKVQTNPSHQPCSIHCFDGGSLRVCGRHSLVLGATY